MKRSHRKINDHYLRGIVAVLTVLLLAPAAFCLANRIFRPGKADNSRGVPALYHGAVASNNYSQTSRYLEMKDGTRLALEIYLPDSVERGEKFPTIVEQTRYWRVITLKIPFRWMYRRPIAMFRRFFAKHGYAWVTIDARAGGASFGTRPWEFAPIDVADHNEVVNWVVKQSWSNGRVGLIGHSYAGDFAELSLLNKNPAVKAAAIVSSPFDLFADIIRPGGLTLESLMRNWAALTVAFDQNRAPQNLPGHFLIHGVRPVDGDSHLTLLRQALLEHKSNAPLDSIARINYRDDLLFDVDALHKNPPKQPAFLYSTQKLRDYFGDDFTNRGIDLGSPSGYARNLAEADIPIYNVAGWTEASSANAAVKRYLNYTNTGSKLILGPWDHNFFNIDPYTRGGITRFRMDEELLKFFDYHLLDRHNALDQEKPVHYFTLGEEKWHKSDIWPPHGKSVNFYLSPDRRLSEMHSSEGGADHFKIDPLATAGTKTRWDCMVGNPLWNPYSNRVSADKRLLTYQSGPFSSDTRITGHPTATLFIRPGGADCAIFAYLEDVSSKGSVRYISEGEVLAGFRLDPHGQPLYKSLTPQRLFTKASYSPLEAGAITKVEFEILPVSYLVRRGHSLRLAIAGADRDHFRMPKFAHMSDCFDVLTGASSASFVTIPIDQNSE